MPLRVTLPNGEPGDPQSGVTPIMVQLEPGHYQVVGTGFYIARYGLFITAKHVVDVVSEFDGRGKPSIVWNWTSFGQLFVRPIVRCSFPTWAPYRAADVAICQAVASAREGGIRFDHPNERIALISNIPDVGTQTGTYAYPGNKSLDFRNKQDPIRIFADVFEGRIVGIVGGDERNLKYVHVDTTIDLRGGASGGPVFSPLGHAFAINCLSWTFGAEEASSPLSSVVPVSHIFDLPIAMPHLPIGSSEEKSVPESKRGAVETTLRELASWGHLVIDP